MTTFYLDTPGSRPRIEAEKGKGKRERRTERKVGMKVFLDGETKREHAVMIICGMLLLLLLLTSMMQSFY